MNKVLFMVYVVLVNNSLYCFLFHKSKAKIFKKENPQVIMILTFIKASKEIYQSSFDKYQHKLL